jgi:hypothetical protein
MLVIKHVDNDLLEIIALEIVLKQTQTLNADLPHLMKLVL